jgi:4-amino-4-deoxy-L-arabinose transferase-like glycosyltransferase
MGLAVGMFMLVGIGLTIATPIALLCAMQAMRRNSRIGALLSIVGAMLFWLPWPILVYGLDWICVQTGTKLGS